MAGQPFFHAGKGPVPQTARPARILTGWQAAPRIPGPILDKKKALLVRREDKRGVRRQHLHERLEKPVADRSDKAVGSTEACEGRAE